MYKITGADGREYGPVTASQLQQWIRQGRANAATLVRPETETGWQRLETLPEFAEALAQPPELPPLPPATPPPARTSRMAITSLVLGALGLFSCGLTSLIGLILGIVALVRIGRSAGRLKGNGLAIAGVIVSAVLLLVMPALMLPALAKAKAKAQTITCVNHAKQLALGMLIHADANTNTCPPAATWGDAIQAEVGDPAAFQCPLGAAAHRSHYAFNARLGGFNLDDVKQPAQTVLFFETDGGWNLSGGSELLPRQPRHDHKVIVAFADGHVEAVAESRLSELKWEP